MGSELSELIMPRVVISGLSGGSGKTLLSLGLTRALCESGFGKSGVSESRLIEPRLIEPSPKTGLVVQPFKKGPDYIDAAWLSLAANRACANLDSFFLSESRLRDLFAHAAQGADMAIIEGNRGLFDGRDAQGTCSTAALARALDAPVILTLNCTKMTRTAAALILGVSRFEDFCFAGVVLNQTGSSRHETLVRQCIEDIGIPVLGALPRLRKNPISERHMGLMGIAEAPDAEESLTRLAAFVREHVDIHEIHKRACVPALTHGDFWPPPEECSVQKPQFAHKTQAARVRVGYVHDKALWFYYPENLQALERAGAELVRLSLFDAEPWPELDGLYLGGGYPELVAPELSASARVQELRRLSEAGMPIYAECGGFMVLCDTIQTTTGIWPMAGAVQAACVFETHPQGLGYVEALVTQANAFHPLGAVFRGHEFHYSRCAGTNLPCALRLLDVANETDRTADCTADNGAKSKTDTGRRKGKRTIHGTGMGDGTDGLYIRRTFAAYTHLYAPAVPHWAPNFLCAAVKYHLEKHNGSCLNN